MLAVDNLRVSFETGPASPPAIAVDGVSFEVKKGETFAIIGESGSGKTLTARSIIGLQPETARLSGSIRFDGKELIGLSDRQLAAYRGRHIGFVYQNPLSALNPVWTIGEQIAETIRAHKVADRKGAYQRVLELLESVHIPDPRRVAAAYPHQVSGGMLQRAVIAMALSCNPALLIADEPTTALDVTIKAQIMDLLSELRQELGLTILLITHDMGVVAELADRIMVMYSGRVAEMGDADRLMLAPSHHYSRALIDTATLSEHAWKTDLPVIPGAAPGLLERPDGCAFRPRCPSMNDQCRAMPALDFSDGHSIACHHPISARSDA
ncbi:MAG: hypothetical protein RLZZ444_515 [Pseudomonadota bacterium]